MPEKIIVFLICSLLGACGRHEEISTTSSLPELEARYNVYHSLAPRGWDAMPECDALLFVSLQHVGLGEVGPIAQAQREPGRWFRLPEPDFAASCGSDISRDMFVGLFTYIWYFHRLDWAEDLWTYGHDHKWAMGEERNPPNNRTVLSPSMIGLLADVIHGLGGQDLPERLIPIVYNVVPGFESHLSLLELHLSGELHGYLTTGELSALRQIRAHMSLNPLVHALIHKYTDGDQTEAAALLLRIWPSDRLPTTSDWSEPWRLQRSDNDPGLQPGVGRAAHSGGDFLFPAALILGRI